MFICLFAVIM